MAAYRLQQLESRRFDTALFEVDSGILYNILDHLRVDLALFQAHQLRILDE